MLWRKIQHWMDYKGGCCLVVTILHWNRMNACPIQNLVQMLRLMKSHPHCLIHIWFERVYCLCNEAFWGKQGSSQASSKMAWENRERSLAWGFFMVVRGEAQSDGSTCSLNFPQVSKERVSMLSYQPAQMWSRRSKAQ